MASTRTPEQRPADVLVIFGITGDLAKVMTSFSHLALIEAASRIIAAERQQELS